MSFSKIDKADWKFVPVDPDPDFNYERNKKIIEDSIKKNEAKKKRDKAFFNEQIKDKGRATASYLLNLQNGRGESNLAKYFGIKEMKTLRGQEFLDRLKNGQEKS